MAGASPPPSRDSRRYPRLAPALLIAGALLLLSGGLLFLSGYKGLRTPDTLQQQPLTLSQPTTLDVALPPGQTFVLTLAIKLAPTQQDGELHYRFPYEYTVRSEAGKVIARRRDAVAWNKGGRLTREERNMSVVEHRLTTLVTPPGGKLKITLALEPDSRYNAVAVEITARIDEGEHAGLGWAFSLFALFVGGSLMVVVGATLLALRSGSAQSGFDAELQQLTRADKQMQKWAMFTHLSALCLYLGIPFGNLLAPLILWQLKRKESPLIEQEGKEALNFQLSVTLYGLLCLLLTYIFIGLLLLPALVIAHLIFTIAAAVRIAEGRHYRYPLTLRILK